MGQEKNCSVAKWESTILMGSAGLKSYSFSEQEMHLYVQGTTVSHQEEKTCWEDIAKIGETLEGAQHKTC